MNKYIISFVLDDGKDKRKMETFTFDNAAERQVFFNSLRQDVPIKDVMFSEYNGDLAIKEEGSDSMYLLTQTLFFFFAFVHSWMGNDVFPILCLIALNEIVNRLLKRKEK